MTVDSTSQEFRRESSTSFVDPGDIQELREKARESEKRSRSNLVPVPSASLGSLTSSTTTTRSSYYNRKISDYWQNELGERDSAEFDTASSGEHDRSSELSSAKKDNERISKSSQKVSLRQGRRVSSQRVSPEGQVKAMSKMEKVTMGAHTDCCPPHPVPVVEKVSATLSGAAGSPPSLQRDRVSRSTPGAFACDGPGAEVSSDTSGCSMDDIEMAGVEDQEWVQASMVSDVEKVEVAENVQRDYHRRNLVLLVCTCIFVVALTVSLVVTLPRQSTVHSPCDLPVEDQSVVERCNCTGTTGSYYESLSENGRETYFQQEEFLREVGLIEANATIDIESCDHDNLGLLVAAQISETSEQGADFWTLTSPDFQLAVHVFIRFYLSTGGPQWLVDENWLTTDVCEWFGLDCGFFDIVQELWIGKNGLVGTLPKEISMLGSIRTFFLNGNEGLGGPLPREIGQLTALQDFVVKGSTLSGTIPTELSLLDKLDRLDLSDNDLSGTIPSDLWGLRSLRTMRLSGNKLSGSLTADIASAQRLIELELGNNDLEGTLPHEMRSMTDLEILSLNGNQFNGPIPSFLGELPQLSLLFLDGSGLTGTLPSTFCDSTLRRKVTLDCPDGEPALCECCSRDDATAQVQLFCASDLEENII